MEDNLSVSSEDVVVEDDESTDDEAVWPKKPKNARVLLEVGMLEEAFSEYPCPKCSEFLELKIKTVCIASSIDLVCNNEACSYVCEFKKPTTTKIHEADKGKYERITDYALNVLFVLGMVSVGDAHTEAGRMLGLLGLPNDTTMTSRSFCIIEDRVGPFIRQLCDEIILENIDEEARLSMTEVDYNVWKMWTKDEQSIGDLPFERWPQLSATYDMAWQQRSSGHVYNSVSGHGSLFGSFSRKIIGLVIKSKHCTYCKTFMKKNPEEQGVPMHSCWRNHAGSSKAMETAAAVELLVDSFENKKVVIARLCCDDDSSIRATCQWSNADYYCKNNNTTVIPKVPISKGPYKGQPQDRKDNG
ncbi:MAG: hypothetical protein ACRCZI_02740, partial [Cetobacterium sp.]